MDPDTMRGNAGDVYWRRRMSVLVGVLVVVAVVAWACSSGSGGPQKSSNAQTVASGSPAADPILAALQSVTPKATPTASATPKPAKPKPPPPKPRRSGQPCEKNDLVLNLEGTQDVYVGPDHPNFMLTLVNTGPVMCTTDVGPRTMEIRITSGADRVWSTSDCVSGDGVQVRRMERGIPYVRTLDWDRKRSGSDCEGKRPRSLAGTYVAVVRTGEIRSPKAVFHLR